MNEKIQRFELNTHYDATLHCPFCGQKILDVKDYETEENPLNPCPHTLFFAHDEALEYSTDLFEQNLGVSNLTGEDFAPENGWDDLTNQVSVTDSIKFACYVGMPSGYGSYLGFAPNDQVSDANK